MRPQLCIEHFRQDFIELSTQLSAVVACRCSPTQKADVARLIRAHTKKRVCCIGDGGNDVSMIQAADVGTCRSALLVIVMLEMPSSFPADSILTRPAHRRRHRRQGGSSSLSRRRFLHQPVQLPHQAPGLARAQLVQAECQARAVCHPSRSHHLGHPRCARCVRGDSRSLVETG